MSIPYITHLANPTLSNDAVWWHLKKLDGEFNQIIKPDSEQESFSQLVFGEYYEMCRENSLTCGNSARSWVQHFDKHPQIRIAAIAEVIHEICLKVLLEKRALSLRIAQLEREIAPVTEKAIFIDPSSLTISG